MDHFGRLLGLLELESAAEARQVIEQARRLAPAEAEALFKRFLELVTSEPHKTIQAPDLGKLEVFSGVREFPVRVKCATLAWRILRAALEGEQKTVTTE